MTAIPREIPRDIVAARRSAANSFAEMDRQLARLDALARDMVAALPRRPRAPGTCMPGKVVTRLTAEAEADVHRAAMTLGLTVSEFGRRALARAALAVNDRHAAGGLPPAAPPVPRRRGAADGRGRP